MSAAQRAANALIARKLELAKSLLNECEQIAKEHEIYFSWNPFNRQEHTFANDNWQSSDPSCWDGDPETWGWKNSSDQC